MILVLFCVLLSNKKYIVNKKLQSSWKYGMKFLVFFSHEVAPHKIQTYGVDFLFQDRNVVMI